MNNYNFYRDSNRPPARKGLLSYFVVGIIGAVVGGMLVLILAPPVLLGRAVPKEETKPQEEQVIINTNKEVSPVTAIAKKVMPAVVGIRTTEYQEDMFFRKRKVEGVGSGVIVDKSGYILTNNHVASKESAEIQVYLADGRNVTGTTLWTDPGLDLSIVKIEADNLTVAETGDSDKIEVGETAVAIGNPLGLRFERSVTAGIISALNRSIPIEEDRVMEDLIQTDASINEGNSGGPLINSEGKVIGINTAKVKTAEGMGFAVPINVAVPVIKSFVKTGNFVTPYIGISALDKEIASFYGYEIEKGVFVAQIDKEGPAYKAGIREEDIILEIDGSPINSVTALKRAIFSAGTGNEVKVKVQDKTGGTRNFNVRLGKVD